MVGENLRRVREQIEAAARGVGRDPAEVQLVCVTKGVPVERIREAIAAGVREIGENRVQEAREKQVFLGTVPFGDSPLLRWHLIGRLQRNKTKQAAELFGVIHSVDSPELIEALEKAVTLRQAQGDRKLEVLIQVNVSGEATKGGCRPEETETLAGAVLKSKHLRWGGLMTMAPYSANPEDARPIFRRLRELRDQLQGRFSNSSLLTLHSSLHLSMGMSGDFETAVQEGATTIRIGTAIFGEQAQ